MRPLFTNTVSVNLLMSQEHLMIPVNNSQNFKPFGGPKSLFLVLQIKFDPSRTKGNAKQKSGASKSKVATQMSSASPSPRREGSVGGRTTTKFA